jgi:ribose transport system ATP-binding protein
LGISAIYQELQLAPTLTIAENVFLGREPVGLFGMMKHKIIRDETVRLFHQLDIEVNPDLLASYASVGLRQMTEVIKVLARGGKVVIMDEPTTSLNESEVDHLFRTVRRLRDKRISVIYISHRMEEIFEVGDRASVLRDGKLIGTTNIEDVSSEKLISMMVGHTIEDKFYKETVAFGEVLWTGRNLLDDLGAVRDVDFYIREGEILGLAGLRGSGFKELARLVGGVTPITGGYLENKNRERIVLKTPQDAINMGIGYLPDDRKGEGLILIESVRNNIILPILPKLSSRGWVDDKKTTEVATKYKNSLDIHTPTLESSVEFLSGGNQQKVIIAKWLASNCRLLVLDAPTQGIDVGAKIEMYKLIADHVKSKGAVILVSSELPELLAIADRILVMRSGRLVGEVISKESSQEEILHMAAAGSTVYRKQKSPDRREG